MKIKKSHLTLLLVAALLVGVAGSYIFLQVAPSNNTESSLDFAANDDSQTAKNKEKGETPENLNKVAQAYSLIQQNYIEDIDDTQLIEGAIEGMLATLEDPHSSYLDVETNSQFNDQIESSFEGIGAEVSMVNNIVTIVAPIKDSPAEKAGLRPNDQVLSVDGKSLEGLNLNEAVAKIRGEKGSEVVLEILRAGAKPFDVTIVRDEIPVETVYSEQQEVDGKLTGIIEITNFSEKTAEEFKTQLDALEEEGIEGLVIDVRGNPGGLLNVTEEILSMFVPEDIPYIQIEDADGNRTPFYSNLSEKKGYPVSVLIDEGSASASEIIAVALKELGYDVVGHTSYGKGTVQQAVPMGDGSSIKLTTNKWLSPNGEWINEKGVEPTIEVSQPDYYYANPIVIEEPLSFDQSDEAIENAQIMLDGLGYQTGRTDGYFSKETEEAVRKFQADYKLKTTGVIDKETAGVIEAKVVESIRNGENDIQLDKALDQLYK
ncbi:PDZ domain-containing protein [Oceanobacillus piezotolerans]|uniref:C-terminal processing peptidase n=1 Tax=Oceanobacillus piezotolerans TaxID=2448030 RepID=A0A498DA79_9BACI|nr:S41 family peptidase [Oceanobacillus piezotolerans]RLL46644.1 PDZ domain-containing protein [Oceanobacillus piezotolerans]